jgi:hypothetical protein
MTKTTPETEAVSDKLFQPGGEQEAAETGHSAATSSEADEIDVATEENYWRKHYRELGYVQETDDYELFEPAFRTGYMGRRRHPGKTFQEVENELRRDYEAVAGATALGWEKAVCAACDAWNQAGGG